MLQNDTRMAVAIEMNWRASPSRRLLTLLRLLHDRQLPVPVAKFIYDILTVFTSVPINMCVPAPYLYSPLLHMQA